MDDQNAVEAPSQIVINGQEFSPDEAQELIETGRKTREYEQKWNTKLDSVWPEYGRLSSEKSQWAQEKQKYEQQLSQFQNKQNAGTDTEVDLEKAKEAARKLGLTLNEDLDKSGYIKREDLDKYYDERSMKEKAVQSVLQKADELEKTIDGSDGRPKFSKKVVLAYAQAYGHDDLEKAYEDMHGDTIKEWKQQQLDAKKNPSLKTFKPQPGNKEPKEVRPTDDNVRELLREKLFGKRE